MINMTDLAIILQVGVKILLKNKEGKYLLLRRSLEKYPEIKGRWDAVGGRIEPGTSLMDNLRREVREETALTIVGMPTLIGGQDILRVPGKHIVRLTYMGEAEGEIVLDTNENDTYQWYTPEEIKNLEDIDVYLKQLYESKF